MGILRTDKVSGLETPTAVTGSVEFDGTTDGLIVAENGDHFDFLNSDFTVECWIYPRGGSSSNFGSIYTKGYDYQLHWKDDTKRLETYLSSNGSSYTISNGTNTGDGSVPANKWSHIAHTREGSTFRLFVNGSLLSTITSSLAIGANTSEAGISDYTPAAGSYELDGDISNLRVLKGTALYTSDFTPPVHALEVIGDTILLCCNNPDSVTAASYAGIGTSHIITTAGNPTVSTNNPSLTRDFTGGTEFQGVTVFDTQGYFVPPSGTTEQRGRGRGLFMGGYAPGSYKSGIDAIQIQSLGNSITFGNLSDAANAEGTSVASSTRAVKGGRASGGNHIEYVTIATTGNAIDFGGDLTSARRSLTGVSNGSRGVFCGGAPTIVNIMDYITIASAGVNAADFGDLTVARRSLAAASSPTRGVVGGGNANPANSDVIDYITIASTGNAIDFGNLTAGRRELGGCSSSTRGVFACGYKDPGATTGEIDYITIASTGNAQDFGDSVLARSGVQGTSNSIRGIFKGGSTPTYQNIIEYVTIATTGNSADFGDGTSGIIHYGGCSDSHGGIS